MSKSFIPKKDQIKREWCLVDAKDKTLGRLATRIARVLQGKHKPIYTPFLLCGDYVVVINASHVRLSGRKTAQKVYDKYSGYPSGRKEITFKDIFKKDPCKILYFAVKGMLPKNRLAKQMLNSLKLYPQDSHSHASQNPRKLEL
ncbi:MAG: 50S ribosomal protein L13 [Candidatus Omnitrophica bacterium]|nr:50S ribosomal protein L13 [Candidatus Omnitrophota bacterium]